MSSAETIENEAKAKAFIETDSAIKDKINQLRKNQIELFNFFLENVKSNKYLLVSYILNCCFYDATERANFGNKQDELGNTAYHYAAAKGYDEVITILNDTRSFHGKAAKRFRYVITNHANEKPLDLCCKAGHLSSFKLMWNRINKPQHNPMGSLGYACLGNNREIIETLLNHSKFKPDQPEIAKVIQGVNKGIYGDKVKQLFEEKLGITSNCKNTLEHLKRHGVFPEDISKEAHASKKHHAESEKTDQNSTKLSKN